VFQYVSLRVADWISAVGRLGQYLADVGRGVREVRSWAGLAAVQMRRIGVQSLPLALIIAVFTGVVLSLQAAYSLAGATPRYFVGTLVEKTVLMELCPVLTGLALAGRVGANIAAELGTMRVTEQVDALETLAYNPYSYLVVPRVLAATIMFPVIVALAMGVAIFAGWLTAITQIDLSSTDFVKGLRIFYRFKDLWYGLVKSLSFGMAVGLIGCAKGLGTSGGAEGVGRNTTEAVVIGAAMILVLDAFWAVVLL
jgi:phospholipid/cholesterol/gamma-HCH transport system permease protein